jgi:O-antigen/teichoic acid export membrane protein
MGKPAEPVKGKLLSPANRISRKDPIPGVEILEKGQDEPPSLKRRLSAATMGVVNSRLARNAGWVLGGQVASFGVQAAYFVVLARLLGSAQYGILAGAAALVNIFSQYSAMGAGILFLRYVSPDHSRFREYWGNILLSIGLVGTLAIVLLYFVGGWLVGQTAASILVILAIGDCLCGQLTAAAAQVFQTFEKMRTNAGLNFLTNVLRLALAVGMALAVHRTTAWTWAAASLAVSFVASLIAVAKVTTHFGLPKFSLKLLFARFGEGFIFAISGSTTTVYNDVDKVMLGHYGMTVANGIYSMAYRIVNICTMPIGSIHSAALPRFFRQGVDGIKATAPFARKLLKRTTILGALGAAAMFLAAPLLPHIAGADFAKSVSAVRWLCLIPLLRSFHLSAGDAISGAGFQRFRLASQFLAAAGNFGINLYLIPRYSWQGAAWASLLTDGSLALMNWGLLFLLMQRVKSDPWSSVGCLNQQSARVGGSRA